MVHISIKPILLAIIYGIKPIWPIMGGYEIRRFYESWLLSLIRVFLGVKIHDWTLIHSKPRVRVLDPQWMSSRVDIVDFSDHHLITFISNVNQKVKRASCSLMILVTTLWCWQFQIWQMLVTFSCKESVTKISKLSPK